MAGVHGKRESFRLSEDAGYFSISAHLQLPCPSSPFLLFTCWRDDGHKACLLSSQSSSKLSFPFPYRKLHSGMKTYGCELCGKRFLDSLRLRMHLLAHSGRRGCPDWLLLAQATSSCLPLSLIRARVSPLPAGVLVQLGCSLQVHRVESPPSCSPAFPRVSSAPSALCDPPS